MAKETEKRKTTSVMLRPSIAWAARRTAANRGIKFSDWHEQVLVAAIPPIYQKGIGKGAK